jgi:predicted metal-dependent hydrolase
MDITYTIERSKRRKTLTITVERDRSIIVHAPESMSDEKIEEVVKKKRQWIYEKIGHPQKYLSQPDAPGKEIVNGESLLYLGRQYRVEVLKGGESSIKFEQKFYIPESNNTDISKCDLLKEWYKERALEKIVPKVRKYARDLGVQVEKIKIVDSRFRWGSCTINNNVTINWRLIKAPMFVIDYIIVHELAHLLETNHTPVFWNIVSTQSPKMEKAKQWLKENGQILEEEL